MANDFRVRAARTRARRRRPGFVVLSAVVAGRSAGVGVGTRCGVRSAAGSAGTLRRGSCGGRGEMSAKLSGGSGTGSAGGTLAMMSGRVERVRRAVHH
jgi:hypothetical protein